VPAGQPCVQQQATIGEAGRDEEIVSRKLA
jgi:hypothetical protein